MRLLLAKVLWWIIEHTCLDAWSEWQAATDYDKWVRAGEPLGEPEEELL